MTAAAPPPSPFAVSKKRRWAKLWVILAWVLAVPFSIYLIGSITGFLKIYRVPTSAMAPTLEPGDHLLTIRFSPDAGELQRSQIVAFDATGLYAPGGVPVDGMWVKRIAALPGDTVSIQGDKLLVNGMEVRVGTDHATPPHQMGGTLPIYPLTIPEDHVFLMGDHFLNSLDSRYIGPVAVKRISYRPLLRVFPYNKMGRVQ